ncbi:MAG TPA: transporter [Candidatus Acidoferrum sp.]|nr:transporter [Candidatus Acidoferrum sp.]
MRTVCKPVIRGFALAAILVGLAVGQELPASSSSTSRQSMQDAWWTGPLLANSANTLPRGHFLVEPYVYDVVGQHSHAFGSRAYIEYGLTGRLTVGLIPIIGYNKVGNGISSSGIQFGDVSLLAQYRLTTFHEHSWVPTIAIQIQQAFPTGKYDQLGTRPSDGLGAGSYATTLALNSQTYFWLPNGRILRTRFNVSETLPSGVDVKGVSVYGTTNGFHGHAEPGRFLLIDAAWEYSMTRRWVLALDGIYGHSGNTTVRGTQSESSVRLDSGASWAYGFAPAVEYNLTPKIGLIFGARVIVPGRNASFTVAPVMAINIFH